MARRTSARPADADETIAAQARAIAKAARAGFDETCEALRRLLRGLPSIQGEPANWPSSAGLHYAAEFLRNAYRALPWREALEFLNTTPLADLEERVWITRYLAGADEYDGLPLFSREELAQQFRAFREFLLSDREYLLQTGLPSKEFPGARWLSARAAKLYVTKRTDCGGPYEEPRCFSGEFSFYTWIRLEQRPEDFSPRRVPCREREADLVAGISAADGDRLRVLREKVFEIKAAVLAAAELFLESGETDGIWTKCLPIIRGGGLTAGDVEFCTRMDRAYQETQFGWNNVHSLLWWGAGYDGPINPGGFTSIVELIWHVQKECAIGTMHRAREALGGLVVDEEGRRVLSADDEEWAYFEYVSDPTADFLHRAIEILRQSADREVTAWQEFQVRVTSDLAKELEREVTIRIPAQTYVGAKAGGPPTLELAKAGSASETKRAERVTARFPKIDGLQWEDVKMEFISEDSIKVTAKGKSKVFMFAEAGFRDERKGDLPDSRWAFFKTLAKLNGELSWKSGITANERGQAKAAIKDIRARLKRLMGIDDDPFYPYKARLTNKPPNSYKTKFSLSSKSDSESVERPEIE